MRAVPAWAPPVWPPQYLFAEGPTLRLRGLSPLTGAERRLGRRGALSHVARSPHVL